MESEAIIPARNQYQIYVGNSNYAKEFFIIFDRQRTQPTKLVYGLIKYCSNYSTLANQRFRNEILYIDHHTLRYIHKSQNVLLELMFFVKNF